MDDERFYRMARAREAKRQKRKRERGGGEDRDEELAPWQTAPPTEYNAPDHPQYLASMVGVGHVPDPAPTPILLDRREKPNSSPPPDPLPPPPQLHDHSNTQTHSSTTPTPTTPVSPPTESSPSFWEQTKRGVAKAILGLDEKHPSITSSLISGVTKMAATAALAFGASKLFKSVPQHNDPPTTTINYI